MNFLIAQSGGPTAVINASLAGICKESYRLGIKVFGAVHGIEGVINNDIIPLKFSENELEILKKTPSAALGSCRYKLLKASPAYDVIKENFIKNNIDAFFYIGGNDSQETVLALSEKLGDTGIRFVGVPKTIDNDLEITDFCPGFGSAANYLNLTLSEIILDGGAYNLRSLNIVEVMGRDTGWLAASTCVVNSRLKSQNKQGFLIYLPESKFSADEFIEDIRTYPENSITAVVSEGIDLGSDYRDNKYMDAFGHRQNAGVGKYLAGLVANELGIKTRAVELNVMQRCSAHLQSQTDVENAVKVGEHAARFAIEGKSGIMAAIKRLDKETFGTEIFPTEVANVAGKVKYFPKEWITARGNGIKDEALGYFLPLVEELPRYIDLGV